MDNKRRRVPAMAPEERRAALIAATIPLLHEHGIDVSTRQIAQAAGVAEGTIFGVFETKTSLVVCSLIKGLDPEPTTEALNAIDRALPLRERLTRAAELVHARFNENAHLMAAARRLIIAEHDGETASRLATNRLSLHTALTDVIGPDDDQLRRTPAAVASLLLLFCGANTFGPFGDPENFSGEETVSLLLDGLLIRRGTV